MNGPHARARRDYRRYDRRNAIDDGKEQGGNRIWPTSRKFWKASSDARMSSTTSATRWAMPAISLGTFDSLKSIASLSSSDNSSATRTLTSDENVATTATTTTTTLRRTLRRTTTTRETCEQDNEKRSRLLFLAEERLRDPLLCRDRKSFRERVIRIRRCRERTYPFGIVLLVAVLAFSTIPTTHSVLAAASNQVTDLTAAGIVNGADIDLLAALQLQNTTRTGVSQVPGLVRLRPAYYLQGGNRELRLNEAGFQKATALLRQVSEFTVAAALRQEDANPGTIIAFSHGNNRYLELESSGRKDELRFHYISRRDGTSNAESFPFRVDDGAWHRVALSISGSQVELLVDCHPLYRRFLRGGPPDTNFTLAGLQLWVGQRNTKHSLFKGALQDVRLIPGPHGYLSQCPQLDSSCPTCGQFSMLQNTVEQLMHNLNELTQRLAAAEGRISKVEECECQKSCRVNGTVHDDGATWDKECLQCSCVHGEIQCRPSPCAPTNCKHPVTLEGECCPKCLMQCSLFGLLYDHGVKVSPKPCTECTCEDGSFKCIRHNASDYCPPLPCEPEKQISVAEECCKFCPGVDYCAKDNTCHTNASCLNLQTTYACHCNIGFQGDGHDCHDVDECKQQGGSEGHHCNANTRCVNTVGSYVCECLPGYHRVDKFNCAESDECATGQHGCDKHATCINTAGSYKCECNEGYSSDGNVCKPVCNIPCQNGGECTAPGKCSCRRGYIGTSCELDLDECASDLHRCHRSSTCFNMPGWYYCRCKPGYRSTLHDTIQGTQCQDIDECNDQTVERKHTCHPTAQCINTEGAYECACTSERGPKCKLSCWFENREVENGETVSQAGNPCRLCSCRDGVISCKDPVCNCSIVESRRDKCCPQCDPTASCRHQELHHLEFRSGDRWIYQCQTCECLYGEIDCWQMECPPVTCTNPVTEDGDCCPRCEDDPCAREVIGNDTSLISSHPRPCSYGGMMHESSSSWQSPDDKCTTCECKDGQLCCSYDYYCAGDLVKRSGQLRSGGASGLPRSQTAGTSKTAVPTASSRLLPRQQIAKQMPAASRAQDSLVVTRGVVNSRKPGGRGNSVGYSASAGRGGSKSTPKTLERGVSTPPAPPSSKPSINRDGAT